LKLDGEVANDKVTKRTEVFHGWGEQYLVEFTIEVNKLPSTDVLNVFHMTSTDRDCCNHGDRLPAVFVLKHKILLFML